MTSGGIPSTPVCKFRKKNNDSFSLRPFPSVSSPRYYSLVIVHFDIIQGDSGGKVDILGGDTVDCCEKKTTFERVSNCE